MLGDFGQAVVQFPNAHSRGGVHLVEKPQNAVAFEPLIFREAAKRTVTAQQGPRTGLRKREGKAIGKGKSLCPLPVGEGSAHPVTIQLFDGKP